MSAPARFFSVPARFSGRVVVRVSAGGSVWAWRAPSAGQLPSPSCLFVPFGSFGAACQFAAAASAAGWPALVRHGSGFAVWQSGPLAAAAPVAGVKVRLPPGVSARVARVALAGVWASVFGPASGSSAASAAGAA